MLVTLVQEDGCAAVNGGLLVRAAPQAFSTATLVVGRIGCDRHSNRGHTGNQPSVT